MQTISQALIVHQFPCLSDNYGYLIHDPESKETAAIDTPDAKVIIEQLQIKGWSLNYIFNTHHHYDHVGGNLELKAAFDCRVFASTYDQNRIPGITDTLTDGDFVQLGNHIAHVITTPGHTLGHIIYHFAEQNLLFVGDTLFSLGCGRLFEGSAQQMYTSLAKIKSMDPETTIYCAHEYTEANAKFSLSIDNNNPLLIKRSEIIHARREKNLPTVPFQLKDEIETNPFLLASSADQFAERRTMKDQF